MREERVRCRASSAKGICSCDHQEMGLKLTMTARRLSIMQVCFQSEMMPLTSRSINSPSPTSHCKTQKVAFVSHAKTARTELRVIQLTPLSCEDGTDGEVSPQAPSARVSTHRICVRCTSNRRVASVQRHRLLTTAHTEGAGSSG